MLEVSSSEEFSCFGSVELTDRSTITIKDIFIPEQKCDGSSTEPTTEGYRKMYEEAENSMGPDESLRCWIHSHVDMKVFWSTDDEKAIENIDNGDWHVAIVINKKGDFKARIDYYRPIRLHVDDLPVKIEKPGLDLNHPIVKEYKEKVKKSYSYSSSKRKYSSCIDSYNHFGLYDDMWGCDTYSAIGNSDYGYYTGVEDINFDDYEDPLHNVWADVLEIDVMPTIGEELRAESIFLKIHHVKDIGEALIDAFNSEDPKSFKPNLANRFNRGDFSGSEVSKIIKIVTNHLPTIEKLFNENNESNYVVDDQEFWSDILAEDFEDEFKTLKNKVFNDNDGDYDTYLSIIGFYIDSGNFHGFKEEVTGFFESAYSESEIALMISTALALDKKGKFDVYVSE